MRASCCTHTNLPVDCPPEFPAGISISSTLLPWFKLLFRASEHNVASLSHRPLSLQPHDLDIPPVMQTCVHNKTCHHSPHASATVSRLYLRDILSQFSIIPLVTLAKFFSLVTQTKTQRVIFCFYHFLKMHIQVATKS